MLANIMFSLLSENIKGLKTHKIIMLPVVLYGCETLSLSLKLRAFENRSLRGTFGPKKEEVAGGCRRLHNEELHNSYASPNFIRVIKSRRMRWAGYIAWMGGLLRRCGLDASGPDREQWRALVKTVVSLRVP
jgi:hypothetical protein